MAAIVAHVDSLPDAEPGPWSISLHHESTAFPAWVTEVPGWLGLVASGLEIRSFRSAIESMAQASTDLNPAYFSVREGRGAPYETSLGPLGLNLLSDYYSIHCNAKIVQLPVTGTSTLDRLAGQIIQLQYSGETMRVGFIRDSAPGHSTPMIYIQEAGKKALFIADSRGGLNFLHSEIPPSVASDAVATFVAERLGVPIYFVEDRSQIGGHGCQSQSLQHCVECTRRNEDGSFEIPGLLDRLERSAVQVGNRAFTVTYLPSSLLTVAQSHEFVSRHVDPLDSRTFGSHAPSMTLSEFRDKHLDPYRDPPQARYLTRKGAKHIDKMQCQHYVDEVERASGRGWPRSMKAALQRLLMDHMEQMSPDGICDSRLYIDTLQGLLESHGLVMAAGSLGAEQDRVQTAGDSTSVAPMPSTPPLRLTTPADIKILTTRDASGLTLVHRSMQEGDADTARILIDFALSGMVDPVEGLTLLMSPNNEGLTALGSAVQQKESAMVTLFANLVILAPEIRLDLPDKIKLLTTGVVRGRNLRSLETDAITARAVEMATTQLLQMLRSHPKLSKETKLRLEQQLS